MHSGKSYKLGEFLFWTRRSIFWLVIVGTVPPVLHSLFHVTMIAIPFTIVALLGSATAFIVGFKNQETYNRTWEARQIWGATMSASRSWAMLCRDFINDEQRSQELIYRQLAWLTALRYQLRTEKNWENIKKSYNREYKRKYVIPERETSLKEELSKFISPEEIHTILLAKNKAAQLLGLQSFELKKVRQEGLIDEFRFLDMHNALREFSDHQGRSERIKNFPYPRQYAIINTILVKLFCLLLPFGLLEEFDQHNIWLVTPFSVLISWIFTSLEQVGESTENPFEGSANDVPISQMSRAVEIDIREMLQEDNLPLPLQPHHQIIL